MTLKIDENQTVAFDGCPQRYLIKHNLIQPITESGIQFKKNTIEDGGSTEL